MWRYEGSRTLAYYLRRRDSLRALAEDMEVPVEAVPAVAMKQLLQGLMVCVEQTLVDNRVFFESGWVLIACFSNAVCVLLTLFLLCFCFVSGLPRSRPGAPRCEAPQHHSC